MNFKEKSVVFLATGGYIGKIPFAPGTMGTIPGILLCFLFSKLDLLWAVLSGIIFILLSIRIAHIAEKLIGEKDPGCIVIDEIAGIVVALAGLPFSITCFTAGFFIFRILDIIKPYPICWIDRKLTGGTGIVMDDVIAGIFTNLILRVFIP